MSFLAFSHIEGSNVFRDSFTLIRYWFEWQDLRNIISVVDKSDNVNFFIKKGLDRAMFFVSPWYNQQNPI